MQMYKLVKLTKENDLNRELRKQKRERGEISILFVSLWDKYSKAFMKKLEREYKHSSQGAKTLFVVDSYNMPHSFVIFNSSILPHYVNIRRNKVTSVDYLPALYGMFGLE